jgi:long-chain acyl-CoA synthetase
VNFIEKIFGQLEKYRAAPVLQELLDDQKASVTGGELLDLVNAARVFIARQGLKPSDRCALLAPNSIRWVAMDLAMIAEGLIVVPLYARQAPAELVAMMKDCSPAMICCGDAALRDAILEKWPDAPPQHLFDDVFVNSSVGSAGPGAKVEIGVKLRPMADSDAVTIIYTSGTSGEAKGVVLNASNVGHMLGCTSGRLDVLMGDNRGQDGVFHYLPFCFAGSWIMLLTCLMRGSLLTLNTDLTKLANDMRSVAPDYFLNVPALLERMRKAVDAQLGQTAGLAQAIYSRAKAAWVRARDKKVQRGDRIWLWLAEAVVFPTIRKKMIGANLKALICGSAPLNVETQLYFAMLGIPVLQVYGLTETTGICTMDYPQRAEPGWVGPAIEGIEMRIGENDEIIVRGSNIFPGYWNRPQESAKVLRGGWFHTGDQGEANAEGNWRILGRVKNLIILGSGHNVAPEPIEDKLLQQLPGAQQVVLVGNGRGYLSAIVTGETIDEQVQAALDLVNSELPHYKQVRAFYIHGEPFSIENGLLTANGKLKRDLISARLNREIEQLYEKTMSA